MNESTDVFHRKNLIRSFSRKNLGLNLFIFSHLSLSYGRFSTQKYNSKFFPEKCKVKFSAPLIISDK